MSMQSCVGVCNEKVTGKEGELLVFHGEGYECYICHEKFASRNCLEVHIQKTHILGNTIGNGSHKVGCKNIVLFNGIPCVKNVIVQEPSDKSVLGSSDKAEVTTGAVMDGDDLNEASFRCKECDQRFQTKAEKNVHVLELHFHYNLFSTAFRKTAFARKAKQSVYNKVGLVDKLADAPLNTPSDISKDLMTKEGTATRHSTLGDHNYCQHTNTVLLNENEHSMPTSSASQNEIMIEPTECEVKCTTKATTVNKFRTSKVFEPVHHFETIKGFTLTKNSPETADGLWSDDDTIIYDSDDSVMRDAYDPNLEQGSYRMNEDESTADFRRTDNSCELECLLTDSTKDSSAVILTDDDTQMTDTNVDLNLDDVTTGAETIPSLLEMTDMVTPNWRLGVTTEFQINTQCPEVSLSTHGHELDASAKTSRLMYEQQDDTTNENSQQVDQTTILTDDLATPVCSNQDPQVELDIIKFKCSCCSKSFRTKLETKMHYNAVHLRPKPYKCQKCTKTFSHKVNMKKHCKLAHGKAHPYKNVCKVKNRTVTKGGFAANCTYTANGKYQSSIEQISCSEKGGDGNFNCPCCSKTFRTEQARQRHHGAIHMWLEHYKCQECQKTFLTKGTLDRHHQAVHTGTLSYKCSACSKVFPQISHLKKHGCIGTLPSNVLQHSCNGCGKVFLQEESRKRHQCMVHEKAVFQEIPRRDISLTKVNVWYKCPCCTKKFRTMQNARRHYNGFHLSLQSYKCQEGGKTFSQKVNRDAHHRKARVKMHPYMDVPKVRAQTVEQKKLAFKRHYSQDKTSITKNNGKFICPVCNKEFKSRKGCKGHYSVQHLGILPYQCSHCMGKFGQNVQMKLHQKKCIGISDIHLYECPVCEGRFSEAKGLHRHQRSAHLGQPLLKSNVCEPKYSNKSDYTKAVQVTTPIKATAKTISFMDNNSSSKTPEKAAVNPETGEVLTKMHTNLMTNLIEAVKMNTEIKCYHCPVCGKGFMQKVKMYKHHRWEHLKLRSYKCSICNKGFHAGHLRDRHWRMAHKTHNSFALKSNEDMGTVHGNLVAGRKSYKCMVCQKAFSKKCNCNRHQYMAHRGALLQESAVSNISPYGTTSMKQTKEKSEIKDLTLKQADCRKTTNMLKYVQRDTRTGHFHCPVCDNGLNDKETLYKHHSVSHRKLYPYKCSICDQKFSEKHLLDRHQHISHKTQSTFAIENQENKRNVHVNNNLETRKYECVNLSKSLASKQCSDSYYEMVHLNIPLFQCRFCKKRFSTKYKYDKHICTVQEHIANKNSLSHKTNNGMHQHFANKMSDRVSQEVQSKRAGRKWYKCNVCKKSFSKKVSCDRHLRMAHKYMYPQEKTVLKDSASTTSNYPHLILDTTSTKAQKPLTGYSKENSTHPRDIIRKHAATKMYECPICAKAFRWQIHCERHYDSFHLGISLYKCTLCRQSFSQKNICYRHLQIMHGEADPQNTTVCQKSSLTSSNSGHESSEITLTKEQETKQYNHGERSLLVVTKNQETGMYGCPICTKLYPSWKFCNAHVHSVHKDYVTKTTAKEKQTEAMVTKFLTNLISLQECMSEVVNSLPDIDVHEKTAHPKVMIVSDATQKPRNVDAEQENNNTNLLKMITQYVCPICDQNFTTKESCKTHQKAHFGNAHTDMVKDVDTKIQGIKEDGSGKCMNNSEGYSSNDNADNFDHKFRNIAGAKSTQSTVTSIVNILPIIQAEKDDQLVLHKYRGNTAMQSGLTGYDIMQTTKTTKTHQNLYLEKVPMEGPLVKAPMVKAPLVKVSLKQIPVDKASIGQVHDTKVPSEQESLAKVPSKMMPFRLALYVCPLCRKPFKGLDLLTEHVSNHFKENTKPRSISFEPQNYSMEEMETILCPSTYSPHSIEQDLRAMFGRSRRWTCVDSGLKGSTTLGSKQYCVSFVESNLNNCEKMRSSFCDRELVKTGSSMETGTMFGCNSIYSPKSRREENRMAHCGVNSEMENNVHYEATNSANMYPGLDAGGSTKSDKVVGFETINSIDSRMRHELTMHCLSSEEVNLDYCVSANGDLVEVCSSTETTKIIHYGSLDSLHSRRVRDLKTLCINPEDENMCKIETMDSAKSEKEENFAEACSSTEIRKDGEHEPMDSPKSSREQYSGILYGNNERENIAYESMDSPTSSIENCIVPSDNTNEEKPIDCIAGSTETENVVNSKLVDFLSSTTETDMTPTADITELDDFFCTCESVDSFDVSIEQDFATPPCSPKKEKGVDCVYLPSFEFQNGFMQSRNDQVKCGSSQPKFAPLLNNCGAIASDTASYVYTCPKCREEVDTSLKLVMHIRAHMVE